LKKKLIEEYSSNDEDDLADSDNDVSKALKNDHEDDMITDESKPRHSKSNLFDPDQSMNKSVESIYEIVLRYF
jgi:hypothetical protein